MEFRKVQKKQELVGIKKLLESNHKENLSPKEQNEQGFITINYSLEALSELNRLSPSIIALEEDQVVGYALSATRASKSIDRLLDELIFQIEKTSYNQLSLSDTNFIIVGQLCVAKPVRQRGVSQRIYQEFKKVFSEQHPYCITCVDAINSASLKSHQKRGFKTLKQLGYGREQYDLIIWDWK